MTKRHKQQLNSKKEEKKDEKVIKFGNGIRFGFIDRGCICGGHQYSHSYGKCGRDMQV
jgi:hypothetical protein